MRKSIFLAVVVVFFACSGNKTGHEMTEQNKSDSTYLQYVNAARKNKDKAFAMNASSPFHDAGPDFTGLKYFPVSLKWRIKALWNKGVTGTAALITDTKGKVRNYEPAGVLNFEMQGKRHSLPVYYEDLDKQILFVMFRDSTNGKSTYGGGRYLEFRVEEGKEQWLDFNQAYNPFCHYNHNYACPLVPPTHKLNLSIEAGEKLYSAE